MGVDASGNPTLMPGTEAQFKAYLKPAKDPKISYSIGVDSNKQYFKGYIVEPTSFPDGFKLPQTVPAKKRRGDRNLWDEGKFEILPVYLPIDIVEDVLGTAIVGYFFTG